MTAPDGTIIGRKGEMDFRRKEEKSVEPGKNPRAMIGSRLKRGGKR